MAWYVAHTKSGFEQKVKSSIENQVKLRKLGNKIFRVVVPQEESLEVVKGQRRPVKHKVYPGYVFIEMEFTEDSWSLIKNTEDVTHFLGSTETGKEPTPIKEAEVQTILNTSMANVQRKLVRSTVMPVLGCVSLRRRDLKAGM